MKPQHLNLVRITAFILTIVLIFGQKYIPQKTLDIEHNSNVLYTLYSDGDSGGSSKASWVDEKSGHWKCSLIKSDAYPVCGLSLTFSQVPYKTIDAEMYHAMKVELKYKGPSKKMRISLRNINDLYSDVNTIETAKFHSVNLRTSDLISETTISMHEFSVADWWKDKYDIPRSLSTPEFKNLASIGIDQASPEVFGDHEYQLVSMRFVGNWISAETLYISIIIGWMLILALEAISWFLALRERSRDSINRLSELKVESDKYKVLSSTDSLTGVTNRGGFSKRLELINNANNDQLLGYAVMVLDIDHFKSINDEHGHFVGDDVLKEFAERVSTFIRAEDIFARWGGEEFIVLARLKSSGAEYVLAEKIRAKIEGSNFGADNSIKITVSIGVAVSKAGDSFDELFKQADNNLYTAKRSGRNQVIYNTRLS